MDTDVPDLVNVQMADNMMCFLSAVNAQLEQLGMELSVLSLINAEVDNFSMKDINVFALMEHISKMVIAKILDVLEDKSGMAIHVSANKVIIGMDHSAFFALMDNYGIKDQDLVSAKLILSGMEISVKKV